MCIFVQLVRSRPDVLSTKCPIFEALLSRLKARDKKGDFIRENPLLLPFFPLLSIPTLASRAESVVKSVVCV